MLYNATLPPRSETPSGYCVDAVPGVAALCHLHGFVRKDHAGGVRGTIRKGSAHAGCGCSAAESLPDAGQWKCAQLKVIAFWH